MKATDLVRMMLILLLWPGNYLMANPDPSAAKERGSLAKERKLQELQVKADVLLLKIQDLRSAKKMATIKTEKTAIRQEVRKLRAELKALEAEARAVSGGIYIGSGALILIIILLLLL